MNSVDKITLQYLLNPNIYDKINSCKKEDIHNLERHNKYKVEILKLTEDMFNNNFINEQIKYEFNNYCKNLVYHINNQELKNIIQDEYKDFKPKNKKNKLLSNLSDVSNFNFNDLSLNLNNILNKSKKSNNLNTFIIKNSNKKEKILPKKKDLDHL